MASLEDGVHDTVMLSIQGGASLGIQVFYMFSGSLNTSPWGPIAGVQVLTAEQGRMLLVWLVWYQGENANKKPVTERINVNLVPVFEKRVVNEALRLHRTLWLKEI